MTGIAGVCAVYFIIFLLQEKTVEHLFLIGLIYGLFNGMYWVAYHVLAFDFTNTKNRGNFAGFERAIKITSNLVGPALGGVLISSNVLGLGYGSVFLLGILSMFMSMLIGSVSSKVEANRAFHLTETIREIRSDIDLRRIMYSNLFSNIGQTGALRKIIPIFLFAVLASELQVGGWITFFTALSIITTIVFGKYINYARYQSSGLTAGTILSISLFSLITAPSLVTYILYGYIKELLTPISLITRRVYYSNLLHKIKDYNSHRVEYLVFREWVNLGGRIISFIPLLFIPNFESPLLIGLMVLMSIATFLDPFMVYRIKTNIHKL